MRERTKEPTRLTSGALEELAAEVARKTAPIFAASEWQWRDGVPDEPAIAACLTRLIAWAGGEHAFNGGESRTGRFAVARWIDEGDDVEQCSISLEVGSLAPVQAGGEDTE